MSSAADAAPRENEEESLPLFSGADDSRNDISDVGLLLLANDERLIKNPQPLSSSTSRKKTASARPSQLLPHEQVFAGVATHFTGSENSFSESAQNLGDFGDEEDAFLVPKEGLLGNRAAAAAASMNSVPTGPASMPNMINLSRHRDSHKDQQPRHFASVGDKNIAASTTLRFFGAPGKVVPPSASTLARQNERSSESSRKVFRSDHRSKERSGVASSEAHRSRSERSGNGDGESSIDIENSRQSGASGTASQSNRSSRVHSMSGDASDEEGGEQRISTSRSVSASVSGIKGHHSAAAIKQPSRDAATKYEKKSKSHKSSKHRSKSRLEYEQDVEEETMHDFQERIRQSVRLEEDNEKREMLLMFWEKKTQEGAQVPKKFFDLGLKSDLQEMRWWYYKLIRDTRINDAVSSMRGNMVQGVRGALFVNNLIGNPLGLRLDADFTKELQNVLSTKADRHLREHVKSRCGVSGPKSKPWTHIVREVWECGYNYHNNKVAMETAQAKQTATPAPAQFAEPAQFAATPPQQHTLAQNQFGGNTGASSGPPAAKNYMSAPPQFQPDKKPLSDVFLNMSSEMRQAPIPTALAPPNVSTAASTFAKPTNSAEDFSQVAERVRQRLAQQDVQTRMQQQQTLQEQIALEKQRQNAQQLQMQQQQQQQQQEQQRLQKLQRQAQPNQAARPVSVAAPLVQQMSGQKSESIAASREQSGFASRFQPAQSIASRPPLPSRQPLNRLSTRQQILAATRTAARSAPGAPMRAVGLRDLTVAPSNSSSSTAPLYAQPKTLQPISEIARPQPEQTSKVELLRTVAAPAVDVVQPSEILKAEKHPLEVELENLRKEREREMMIASSRVPIPEADNQTLESLMGTLEAHYRADKDTADLAEEEKSNLHNMPMVPQDDKLSDMMSMIGDFTSTNNADTRSNAPQGRPKVTNLDEILGKSSGENSTRTNTRSRTRITDDDEAADNAAQQSEQKKGTRMLQIESEMNRQGFAAKNEQPITTSSAASQSAVTPENNNNEQPAAAPSTPTRAPMPQTLVARQGRNKSGAKKLTFSTPRQ